MSAEASGFVYRHSPYRGATFQVHLAVADSVNDQHNNEFWMGQKKLAVKTRLNRSTVNDALDRLLADNFLRLLQPGSRHASNKYRFLFPDVPVVYESRFVDPEDQLSAQPTPGLAAAEPDVIDPVVPQEAVRLCDLLAARIVANGCKPPTVTKAWLADMDRLIRIDGREPNKIEAAINWATNDSFWRSNILSPGKLREKYDQLRLAAANSRGSVANAPSQRIASGIKAGRVAL